MSNALHASNRGTAGTGPILLVLVAKYRDLGPESAAALHSASARLAPHLVSEPVSGPVSGLVSGLVSDGARISASVVLSTCNRFEIYCELPSLAGLDAARGDILDAVVLCSGLPMIHLAALFEELRGAAAVEHLFAVAAGLDSVVVGEREVAGQVRRALADAQAAGTASGRLGRLFQAASRTAKDVGAQTALGSAGRSIAAVALDLAAAGTSAVLLGTGAYAGCVVELLKTRRYSDISVFSHSGRADAFVAARGGRAVSARQLPAAVAGADLVIGCSGSGARIDAAALARWRVGADRPLTVIDLAPSHDFDPQVAELPGVELITLESVHLAAPPADAEALRHARALVRQAAVRFEEQDAVRAVDSAVVALREHLHQVLRSEMERVGKQRGRVASADDVNLALRHLLRRLLHTPTVRARELAALGRQDDYTAALEALFGLSVQADSRRTAVSGNPAGPARVPAEATEETAPEPAAPVCGGTRGPGAGCPGSCSTFQLLMRPPAGIAAPAATCRA